MGTADHIASHARERPDALALMVGERRVTYAELSRDIGKFAAALREFGLPPGSMVAIGCADLYVHWLLLLAFERLNVATASVDKMESPAAYRQLFESADLVLSDAHISSAGAARHHSITEAWVAKALAAEEPEPPAVPHGPGDLARILRSSGSTGLPKRLASTRRMFELRVARYGGRYRFSPGSRYILTLSFAVGHIYYSATACLRAGGTVIGLPTGRGDVGIFAQHGITHVSMHPLLLKQILDSLPANFTKPRDLAVFTFGSPGSDELGERALRRLATEVTECFGCNEVGNVSGRRLSQHDDFGVVAPDVEVQVVDDDGRPLRMGQPGRLRIRSESMVDGYIDDPETTRQFFRDGWFHSSDIAVLADPRRLKVLGRADSVINIAGGKLAPDLIEAQVLKQGGVGDVGVCAFGNSEGIQELYIGVANAQVDQRELLNRITRALEKEAVGEFRVVMLASIPRNIAGKIDRASLKEAISGAIGRSQKPRDRVG